MPFALGLDCGGSSSRALMINDAGDILFSGRSGPANLASTPRELIIKHLRQCTGGCPPPDCVVGCFAGLVSQVEKRRALEILGAFFPSARLEARPDYHAIAATAGREISATAISGTGTVVTGWSNGEIVKTGGGGPLIGDDGSTYHMGKLALRALINGNEEALGFEPLLASMEEIFGSRIPHEVVTEVYQSPSPAASLAKLAPSVAAAEQAGLVFGKEIAATVLDHLSGLIDLHIDRFNPEALSVRIAVAGGLFKVDPTYSERLFAPELGPFSQRASVKRRYSTQPLEDEPILGAARLAKRLSQDLSTT